MIGIPRWISLLEKTRPTRWLSTSEIPSPPPPRAKVIAQFEEANLTKARRQRSVAPVKKIDELLRDSHLKSGATIEQASEINLLVNPQTGEVGGQKGPEPTRYGDWERNGRISDF